ncbi:hypothetical protein Tco_0610492 [Tanacetum coccineum]
MSTPTQLICDIDWDRMSTPTQFYCGIDLGSDEYAYSVLVMVPGMDRRDTSIPCLCGTFWFSLLLTPLCCDDTHDVTPCVFGLAGCDRLVSEPGYKEVEDLEEEPIEEEPLEEPNEEG